MSVHHERILSSMLRSLETGCPIVTADGEQIGTLSDVGDEAIKVDAPMRRDFWIGADYVRSCDGGRIELSFIKNDLGAYKMSEPAPTALDTTRAPVAPEDAVDRRMDIARPSGIAFPSVSNADAVDPMAAPSKLATDPLVQGKADNIISEQEQMETRLRMERELASQRQELPHLHPQGEDGPPDTFGTMGEPVESELSRHGIEPGGGSYNYDATKNDRTRIPYVRFLAVAAALIPLAAAAYWLRNRQR